MLETLILSMVLNTTGLEPTEYQEPITSVYSGGGGGDPDGEPEEDPTNKKRD